MSRQRQPGLFDVDERAAKLTALGDPLVKLKAETGFEAFRPDLNRVPEKDRQSNAGPSRLNVVLMFRVLVLQHLYNLSDDGIEYQIRGLLSFMRFLGLQRVEHLFGAQAAKGGHAVWTIGLGRAKIGPS